VIFVFDPGKTRRDALNAACLQFLNDGSNVLGEIRNRSDITWRSRGAYAYCESYGAK
jgi:Mrp family chromosome partitioning ATPase